MATSSLTENELMQFSALTKEAIGRLLSGKSVGQALVLRRNVQIALANYSRNHKFDFVQENTLAQIQLIEKWARRFYIHHIKNQILREHPTINIQKLKSKCRASYERFLRERGF